MKFFDMIRRSLVYNMARAAGMPDRVLVAYMAYLENMQVSNCLAGGGGAPHTGGSVAFRRGAPSPCAWWH